MATSTLGLGRRRWSSPRQCYLHISVPCHEDKQVVKNYEITGVHAKTAHLPSRETWTSTEYKVPLACRSPHSKRNLEWFRSFSTAHGYVQQMYTHRHTHKPQSCATVAHGCFNAVTSRLAVLCFPVCHNSLSTSFSWLRMPRTIGTCLPSSRPHQPTSLVASGWMYCILVCGTHLQLPPWFSTRVLVETTTESLWCPHTSASDFGLRHPLHSSFRGLFEPPSMAWSFLYCCDFSLKQLARSSPFFGISGMLWKS